MTTTLEAVPIDTAIVRSQKEGPSLDIANGTASTGLAAHGLAARGLAKSYAGTPVVANVSLSLVPGQVLGLLGPNGAGKSTTISMLSGTITPDAGEVTLDGEPWHEQSAYAMQMKRRIGVVPQDVSLFEELSARINLEIFGALYGLSGSLLASRVNAALDQVGLSERAQDPPTKYSGGMKRRLNIAAALIHHPDILFFDEPTVGIDPQSRNAISENIATLKAAGKAILYSTHYMEEAERLCDRIVIMDRGRAVANDTLDNLLRLLPTKNEVVIDCDRRIDTQVIASLAESSGVRLLRETIHDAHVQYRFAVTSLGEGTTALINAMTHVDANVLHLATERATLESLFLSLTGRALRDA
jgi:ABC-2 type transport system ATP-binding protein